MARKTTSAASKSTKSSGSKKSPSSSTRTSSRAASTASLQSTDSSSASTRRGLPLKLRKSHVFLIAGVIIIAALLYTFRSVFVAAVVNGQPISRVELVRELEKQGGKQALNSLITKTLILQEAQKQNVSVSQEEIDTEVKKIEDNLSQQGQKLEDVLALQGMTREALTEQIRIQKMVEKMVGKDIQVTDEEVATYMEENQDLLGETASASAVKEQLRQEKLSEKFQTWLQNLQSEANISHFVTF